MKLVILLSFLAFSLGPKAIAKNGILGTSYNEIMSGRYCYETTGNDLKAIGYQCKFLSEIQRFAIENQGMFENIVFKKAKQYQLEKNQCFIDRIEMLKKNKQMRQSWYSQLVSSWLAIRKAELVIDQCKMVKNELRRNSRANVAEEVKEFCNDDKKIATIKEIKKIFVYSPAVISSPEFFKVIAEHRSDLIDTRTGKPISDQTILNLDLSGDLNFLDERFNGQSSTHYRLSAPFIEKSAKEGLFGVLDNIAGQRKLTSYQLRNEMMGISSDAKEFMYADGTVFDVLVDLKQMTFSDSGQYSSISDRKNTSRGAACMMAKYDSDLITSVADFVGGSVIVGGATTRIAKGAGELMEALKDFAKFEKMFELGMAVKYAPVAAMQVINMCTSPLVRGQFINSSKLGDMNAQIASGDIPKEYGYEMKQMDAQIKKIPSCKRVNARNLVLSNFRSHICAKNIGLLLLGMKVPKLGSWRVQVPASVIINQ